PLARSSSVYIDIFTLASSTPDPSAFTLILTLKSTTRLTATRTFMNTLDAFAARYGAAQNSAGNLVTASSRVNSRERHRASVSDASWRRPHQQARSQQQCQNQSRAKSADASPRCDIDRAIDVVGE